MSDWFSIDKVDHTTFIISEYRHWEETHCYLLIGRDKALLIDTGLGICNIRDAVAQLTKLPVAAVATHIHWDHIGGHWHFPEFYAHAAELPWLQGAFPLTMEQLRGMVTDRCDLPEGYDVSHYRFFQGTPARLLQDNDRIDIGSRVLQVFHTPGHSPGHMCFYEPARGWLFTGDLIYKDTLFAYYPSTDPEAYLHSVERVAALPVSRIFPAHLQSGYSTGDTRQNARCLLAAAKRGEAAPRRRGFPVRRFCHMDLALCFTSYSPPVKVKRASSGKYAT